MGDKIKNRPLSYKEKLDLMIEYMESTGKRITTKTEYKGYKLGAYMNNMRRLYRQGKLKIDSGLLQEFIQHGIIKPEKERKEKTSIEEKCRFLIENANDFRSTLKGRQYSVIRNEIQNLFNIGMLTEDQIAALKAKGILNLSPNERNDILQRYQPIPAKIAIDIERQYGSLEAYISEFKKGKAMRFDTKEMFMGHRIITISESEMSEADKNRYYEFIVEMVREISVESYIDIDELNRCISELLPSRREFVERMFFNKEGTLSRKEMANEKGLSQDRIRVILRDIRYTLQEESSRFIKSISKEQNELSKLQKERERMNKAILDIVALQLYLTDRTGKIKNTLKDISLQELGITGEAFLKSIENVNIRDLLNSTEISLLFYNLDRERSILELDIPTWVSNVLQRNGIKTIEELTQMSQEDILAMDSIGDTSLGYISEALSLNGLELRSDVFDEEEQSDEQKKIERLYSICEINIERYRGKRREITNKICKIEDDFRRYEAAHEYFMNEEDVLNPEATIPAIPNDVLRKKIIYSIQDGQTEVDRIHRWRGMGKSI